MQLSYRSIFTHNHNALEIRRKLRWWWRKESCTILLMMN